MKRLSLIIWLVLLSIPLSLQAQQYRIKTIAGKFPEGKLATEVSLHFPMGIVKDAAGNLYIADVYDNSIRKVDASTQKVTTIAGTGINGTYGDGIPAIQAALSSPRGIALDATESNLYIAESRRIRKINLSSGIISTVAGSPNSGGYSEEANLLATNALLHRPSGIVLDQSGNIFFSDIQNNCVQKIDAATGYITTIAGRGIPQGNSPIGDNEVATNAILNSPQSIAFDAVGNVYIADMNHHRIRKVNTSSNIITTFAGNGIQGSVTEGADAINSHIKYPKGITFDNDGNLYITELFTIAKVDASDKIYRFAGGGFSNNDGIPATQVRLKNPYGITSDATGNVFFTEYEYTNRFVWVRKVEANNQILSNIIGNGFSNYSGDGDVFTESQFDSPKDFVKDATGNLYILDSQNHCVRKVDAITGIITTIAGTGTQGNTGHNIAATEATFGIPQSMLIDAAGENLYINDHSSVRKINLTTGIITTIAGHLTERGNIGNEGDGGLATNAKFRHIADIAIDVNNNLYIADGTTHRIRKIDATTGIINTIAGNGNAADTGDNGLAINASLNTPGYLATDAAGNLYVGTYTSIRKIETNTGIISAVAPYRTFNIQLDNNGHIYFTANNSLYKIAHNSNEALVIAGGGENPFIENGWATDIKISSGIRALLVEDSGNVLIGTGLYEQSRIYQLTPFSLTPDILVKSFNAIINSGANHEVGTATLNTSKVFNLTIHNTGGVNLDISQITVTGDFTIQGETPTDIASESAKHIALVMSTATIGDKTGTLTIQSNDPDTPTYTIQLTGKTPSIYNVVVKQGTTLFNTGDTYDFGLTERFTPLSKTFTIVNNSDGATNITYLDAGGDFDIQNIILPFTLAAGASQTLTITMKAQNAGKQEGALYVRHSTDDLPKTYKLNLTGLVPSTPAKLEVKEDTTPIVSGITYDFGSTVKSLANTRTFTLYNTGTQKLYINDFILTGDFSVIGALPSEIEGESSLEVTIAMEVSNIGNKNGTLTIGSSNSNVTDYNLSFIGKVVDNQPAEAYTLHHYAGAYPDGLLASKASITQLNGMTQDAAGNLYLAEIGANNTNYRIRKVDASTGKIHTIAGTGVFGYTGNNGPAQSARLYGPQDIAVDNAGNVYFIEGFKKVIRRIDVTTGIISVFAGNEQDGFVEDGQSLFNAPIGNARHLKFHNNALYLVHYNRIRKMDIGTGIVTTIVGNGRKGYSNDGEQALETKIDQVEDITFDRLGNLFFIDKGKVRKLFINSGIVQVYAGYHNYGYSSDGRLATKAALDRPKAIVLDDNLHLYIAERTRIRKVNVNTKIISTIAGNGSSGYGGDGGSATNAKVYDANHLLFDNDGNLLIGGHTMYRIRKVDFTTKNIETIIGTGESRYGVAGFVNDGGLAKEAYLNQPWDVATDAAGNLYIADAGNNSIRKVDATTGQMTTIADIGLNFPRGVAVDTQGNVYVADSKNGRIGKIDLATGNLITLVDALTEPQGIAVDAQGNIYFTDHLGHRIQKLNVNNASLLTIGGTGNYSDSKATGYMQDGQVATALDIGYPEDLTVDANGNVYFTSRYSQRVHKIDATTGVLSTVAGSGPMGSGSSYGGYAGDNGPATNALLKHPTGVKLDALGNIYIVDRDNQCIRRVNANTGIITTIAGVGTVAGFYGDNIIATNAHLYTPQSIAIGQNGQVFIADMNNHRIAQLIPIAQDNRQTRVKPSTSMTKVMLVKISTYPNPASDQITISINAQVQAVQGQVAVYNLQGQLVMNSKQTWQNKQTTLSVAQLPQGQYFCKIVLNKQIYMARFIKQ